MVAILRPRSMSYTAMLSDPKLLAYSRELSIVTTACVGCCPISALLPTSLFPVSIIEMLSESKSQTISSPPPGPGQWTPPATSPNTQRMPCSNPAGWRCPPVADTLAKSPAPATALHQSQKPYCRRDWKQPQLRHPAKPLPVQAQRRPAHCRSRSFYRDQLPRHWPTRSSPHRRACHL